MISPSVTTKQMNRLLFFLLFFGASVLSYAQELPNRPSPPRLVNDFANIISDREQLALEKKLVGYSRSTSTQITVVTIPSLEGSEIAEYSFRLGEQWGIGGKGKDNGVLVLVSLQDKKMFIATGYGLEGVIPDALAKRIVENYMKPNFRNKNYYKGLDEATTVIMGLANGEFTADQIGKRRRRTNPKSLIFPLLMMAAFIFFSYSRFKNAKGSQMGGRNLNFLTFLLLASSMGGGGRGYSSFSSGGGSFGGGGGGFGGFGGGSFGGGGAGGSW